MDSPLLHISPLEESLEVIFVVAVIVTALLSPFYILFHSTKPGLTHIPRDEDVSSFVLLKLMGDAEPEKGALDEKSSAEQPSLIADDGNVEVVGAVKRRHADESEKIKRDDSKESFSGRKSQFPVYKKPKNEQEVFDSSEISEVTRKSPSQSNVGKNTGLELNARQQIILGIQNETNNATILPRGERGNLGEGRRHSSSEESTIFNPTVKQALTHQRELKMRLMTNSRYLFDENNELLDNLHQIQYKAENGCVFQKQKLAGMDEMWFFKGCDGEAFSFSYGAGGKKKK